MKPVYIFLLLGSALFFSCNSNRREIARITRDTTITSVNAFSKLFLDSAKLERFITQQALQDSTAMRLRNFYNSRNYQFAWFTEDGLAEQGRAFWNLYSNYINLAKDSVVMDEDLRKKMNAITNDSISAIGDSSIIETELQLTRHFFNYAQYAYGGRVDPSDFQWHIPRKKIDPMALLDSLIANKGQNTEHWEPVNRQYTLMYKELKHYYDIDNAGGWKEIEQGAKKNYKPGDSALTIKEVKRRLAIAGVYNNVDTSAAFTGDLTIALKQAQKSFGFKQDGIINTAIIKQLNVPVKARIEQMLVNMERMRWMPKEPLGYRLLANIPEFKLHVFDSSKQVFEMNIVVGTAAHSTVVFNDTLKYIVFSPYWNVPSSIVRNEILPAIRRNSNYLARNNMEQTGSSGGLPVIRQKPGGSNALGRVKFLFPNSFNIYFHDTPSKSLFDRQSRAFSHGCIRLAEPKKLAEYLLRNQPEWTDEKIAQAMGASKEKWVSLNVPVPVVITYFTSWISGDGLLNFRDDIYGRDKKMADRLFENTAAL